MQLPNYKIQDWLFQEGEGRFEIDLAESGIQYHHIHNLNLRENYHLNYSSDCGDQKLRQIISGKYGRDPSHVILTNGSQEALYLFYRSLLNPGDHVITFSPGWQQSWEVPKSMGANVSVINLAENSYEISLAIIEPHITEKTKLIILNSPHNPIGKTLPKEILSDLKEFCFKRNIFILNDEEYLTNYSSSIVTGDQNNNTACVSSLSKVFGFPGLRLGWFVGPKELVNQMINYRRYVTVCNSHLSERLAEQVLSNFNEYIDSYENMTSAGLKILQDWTSNHPELRLISPQGTPFAYISFITKIGTKAFARKLLDEQKVLIMPAEVFNDENAFRVSFGRPANILKEGLGRISKVLASLK
ncbi:pyridoxal phosphate-dependent aminotransferase [Candidatus Paracaedibacter symbiosus]|uniref:pyridoxal phosphate-dependent aminotransferase n=1 Tax=Candidatus Paracaedibacter symbiosus TaxID=244582 RepID=UPI0005099C63|nr:pyridoxal phosphate-dependent aminotransferase [Candidatus Paracaedibacter symbiosus]